MSENNGPVVNTVDIATDLLGPNDYNPNRMSEAEFDELRERSNQAREAPQAGGCKT